MPKDAVEILKADKDYQDLTLENKMSIREKQKARREHQRKQKQEFQAKTGIYNKFEGMSFEMAMEQFMYEMDKMEKKERKFR